MLHVINHSRSGDMPENRCDRLVLSTASVDTFCQSGRQANERAGEKSVCRPAARARVTVRAGRWRRMGPARQALSWASAVSS